MSSLAAQLAGIRANNNATILDKNKRQKVHSVSLVYDAKDAASQDFETIYYDCYEALQELISTDSRFDLFEKSLFSETSIRFDRLSQNAEQTTALNNAIDHFCMLVANHLHLQSALRALEWLVRRFQIQIHNLESLLLAVLPWHDQPVFLRILDLVSLPATLPPLFQFLTTCQKTAQGPSKSSLLRVFLRDPTLLSTFNEWSLETMRRSFAYNRQLVFWSSVNTLVAFAYKEEGTPHLASDQLLPLVSTAIQMTAHSDVQIAGYLVLTVLATLFALSFEVLNAALHSVVQNWSWGSRAKGLRCVSQIVKALSLETNEVYVFDQAAFDEVVTAFGSLSAVADEVRRFANAPRYLAASLVVSSLRYAPEAYECVGVLAEREDVQPLVRAYVIDFVLANAPFDPSMTFAFQQFVEKQVTLSTAQLDRLEIALQTGLRRPFSEPQMADQSDQNDVVAIDQSGDLSSLCEAALHQEVSTQRTFLATPVPTSDERFQLWSKLAAFNQLPLNDLRKLARVLPEAELSFMLAIAIGPWPTVSRLAAVRVATAMLRAVLESNASAADYQSVLPLVLFLLSDFEPRIRHESAKLLQALTLTKLGPKSPRWLVSGTSDHLHWLAKHDLANVLKKLAEHSAECELDPRHVFGAARQAGKAAWCDFLMSHAQTTRLPQILWVTLKCLASFKGVAKQLASNLLSQWNSAPVRQQWQQLCTNAKFPLVAVEKALIGVIKSNERTGVQLLLDLMRTRDDMLAVPEAVAEHLQQVWSVSEHPLNLETQVFILESLVDIVIDEQTKFDPTPLLTQLPLSTAMFVTLLEQPNVLPSTSASEESGPLFSENAKRRRRRSSSSLQLRPGPAHAVQAAAERHLKRTTLILELLEPRTAQLEHPARLINLLFDTLERLMALGEGSARLPVLYTEELLANCMIQLVDALRRAPPAEVRELSSVKVNVVVSCIRTSTSPQVQNRLLLLVASLATVCPDAVLHGVMPIFTFMGATTVRLDNDFSAHVIQQTIDKVIPALVAAGDKHEEIEMALMSFVAAFPHIPRHRRNTLFGALIRVLGPQQSLYKLLLLLAQRYAEALLAPTKRHAEAKALVHFATPFLRTFFAPAHQLQAMNSFVKFVADVPELPAKFGLLKIKKNLAESVQLPNLFYEFLAKTAGEPETIAGTQPLRVQVLQANLSDLEWQPATSMLALLLPSFQSLSSSTSSLESPPQQLLVRVLEILPINRFTSVILPLMEPNNHNVMELVIQKFRYEDSDDTTALNAAKEVANHLLGLMSQNHVTALLVDTMESLLSKFGRYMRDEGQRLMSVLVSPLGLPGTADDELIISACLGINSVCQHLGAATYQFFPRFFPALRQQMLATSNPNVELAGFALLAGLVRQMPRFMEAETSVMLELTLASPIGVSPRLQLLTILDEKISAPVLLKSLTQSWPAAFRGGLSGVDMLFVALGNINEKISSRELASEVSSVTDLLIQCLGVREQLTSSVGEPNYNLINQIESRAIEWGVLTVLKLNDRVFRPQFKRIVEWGLNPPLISGQSLITNRQIAVLKFVNRVFTQLKGVVTNYFGYLFDDLVRILESKTTSPAEITVKKLLLQSLIASLNNDQDDFWQAPARFDRLSAVLVAQLTDPSLTHGPLLVKSLVALAANSSSINRKRLNDELSQLLASGASSLQKVWTVRVFSGLYRRLGEDWVANLPQLVPLIAELLDDEDEDVENETRKSLVPVIETVLGESLDRYLA